MTIQDTYKFGSLYVDADLTLENLYDWGVLNEERTAIVEALKESNATFEFDEDWYSGTFYQDGAQQTPLVLIGIFGGYPGGAIDDANAQAAKEWAADRDYIYSFSNWFGGCEMVHLYLNFDDCTLAEAEEAIELAEGYMDYPVLDEELWSQIEWERWEEMIDEMVVDVENSRDIVFTEDQRAYINEAAQQCYGYWEEGYFGREEWESIIAEALDTDGVATQLHQEDKLF